MDSSVALSFRCVAPGMPPGQTTASQACSSQSAILQSAVIFTPLEQVTLFRVRFHQQVHLRGCNTVLNASKSEKIISTAKFNPSTNGKPPCLHQNLSTRLGADGAECLMEHVQIEPLLRGPTAFSSPTLATVTSAPARTNVSMMVTLSISSLPSATGTSTRFGCPWLVSTAGTAAADIFVIEAPLSPPDTKSAEELPVRCLKPARATVPVRLTDQRRASDPMRIRERSGAVGSWIVAASGGASRAKEPGRVATKKAWALGRAPTSAAVV